MNANQVEPRDDDVLQFVRSGRAAMPDAVDARLRGVLPEAGDAAPIHAGSRRLVAAAIVLTGIGVTAAVLWQQRERQAGPASPQDPVRESPQGPPRVSPALPGGRGDAVPAAESRADNTFDAATTVKQAALVLVVEVLPPDDVAAKGQRAKVLRVVHGDADLVGKQVWLAWNAVVPGVDQDVTGRPAGVSRGCLDVADVVQCGQDPNCAWLLAVERQEQQGELLQLGSPFGQQLRGTRVGKAGPQPGTVPLAALRAELLAGLDSPVAAVRADVMTALCHWEGARGSDPGRDSPWRDPDAAKRLLARCDDADATVREQLASSIPRLAGNAGLRAVHTLVFDRTATVRAEALASLKGYGLPEWWQDLGRVRDNFWAPFTHPWTCASNTLAEAGAGPFRSFPKGAVTKARNEGITTPIGTWERQLKKDHAVNHLLGALGLGTTGDPAAVPLLQELAGHADAKVRAAAAGSRVRLHDRTGYDALRALVAGADEMGAVCALDMLRGVATREALDAVEVATRDPRRLVRALAAAGLRDLRPVALHLVDARLGDLQKDKEEMVRIAAGGR